VPLDNRGFAMVQMFVVKNNSTKMVSASYKVDSGANLTTISRKTLKDMGYDESWVKKGQQLKSGECPTVATGDDVPECYKVILPHISIGGYVGYNWEVIVTLSPKIDFRNLLGTNSMNFFNWTFDYANDECRFVLIPQKRRTLFNQEEQSIHSVTKL